MQMSGINVDVVRCDIVVQACLSVSLQLLVNVPNPFRVCFRLVLIYRLHFHISLSAVPLYSVHVNSSIAFRVHQCLFRPSVAFFTSHSLPCCCTCEDKALRACLREKDKNIYRLQVFGPFFLFLGRLFYFEEW